MYFANLCLLPPIGPTDQEERASRSISVVLPDGIKFMVDEDLLDTEPAKVMEEVWRATNINRRMEAAEAGLREVRTVPTHSFLLSRTYKMQSLYLSNK